MRPKSNPPNARAVAAGVLAEVLGHGRSLNACLGTAAAGLQDPREAGLARELAFGVMRWLPRLERVLQQALRRPLRPREARVYALLLLGIYQLIYTRIPPHAALSESVAAAATLGRPWAKKLVNGVLRNVQRNGERLLAEADRDEAAAHAHPSWLVETVRSAWPENWADILRHNNEHPPMALRVNGVKSDREAYLGLLEGQGIAAISIPHTRHGISLVKPMDVERLPGFAHGVVSVQDGAAQLAAELLELAPGQRVLDACAAPGGKTAHMLEVEPNLGVLVAVDKDPARLHRVGVSLRRLGTRAELVCGDAVASERWWDGHPFDRILLDAPCSATGVIRRRPDVKFHRKPEDLAQYARVQERLLEALWPLLAPGGMLLYATCSILPPENAQPVQRLVNGHTDAEQRHLNVGWGHPMAVGRQILPGEDGMDGFFYALLKKRRQQG